MRSSRRLVLPRPSLPFALLCVLLSVLWLAGGASRADALGQVLVRGVSALLLMIMCLFGERPALSRARPVVIFLALALLLVLLQLVPLPPGVWQAFPGRAVLVEAAAASGQAQPWRPWSVVPGATVNAAASLIVPVTTLVLVTGLERSELARLPQLILGLILVSTLIGLLQFTGVSFNNPFANDTPGQVGGMFANRNHFALFLAFGCLLVPAWAFHDAHQPGWRLPVALGLLMLFTLTILASGSRAGLGLGILALAIGLLLVRRRIKLALRRYPRWAFPALIAGIVGIMAISVLISVAADRAVSIDRAFAVDSAQDIRQRALPTVFAMIQTYFPMGSGFGGFDPLFQMHEPFQLLKLTKFNHAHNDLLEIVLDGGLFGLLLLLSALLWWGWASVRAWRADTGGHHLLPKLGSALLLLILLASVTDYPARTPIMMAMIVIAGVWLSRAMAEPAASALPGSDQHL